MYSYRRRSRTSGFILLEVLVALVILGIAVGTIMRSFTLSMAAIRKNDVSTQAFVLAESMLQNLEVKPPSGKGKQSGSFEADGYPNYLWQVETKEEEIRYKHLKTASRIENLKTLNHVKLKLTYDDRTNKVQTPVDVDLILPPIERFSYQSKFLNELFKDEAKR
jgi:type II secretion system protein I